MSRDFLMHYGIQGQKWGVRRYQYLDKTLTTEGKKRYGTFTPIKSKGKDDKHEAFVQKSNGDYERAAKSSGWNTDYDPRFGVQISSYGKFGDSTVEFDTGFYNSSKEKSTPESVVKKINESKSRYQKESKKIIESVRESLAKKYYDNADESEYSVRQGLSRDEWKRQLTPSSIRFNEKSPNETIISVSGLDGLVDFDAKYDINDNTVKASGYRD